MVALERRYSDDPCSNLFDDTCRNMTDLGDIGYMHLMSDCIVDLSLSELTLNVLLYIEFLS